MFVMTSRTGATCPFLELHIAISDDADKQQSIVNRNPECGTVRDSRSISSRVLSGPHVTGLSPCQLRIV